MDAPILITRSWLPRVGLRARLVAAILLIFCPIVALLFLTLGALSAAEMRSQAQLNLVQASVSAANTIDQWDEHFVLTLQNLRGQPDIISMQPEDQLPVIMQMKSVYRQIDIMRVTAPNGTPVARTDGDSPVNYSDRDWFKAIMHGATAYRQVLITRTSGKPAVNFSTPVFDDNGNIVGVLSAVTALASLPNILYAPGNTPPLQTFLVDGQGQALLHPDVLTASGLINLGAYPPVKNAMAKEPGVFSFKDNAGRNWYSHSVRLRNGWLAVSQIPEDVVLARGMRLLRIAAALMVLTILLLVVFTRSVVKPLLAPIRDLEAGARQLAAGHWSHRVPVSGADKETDELSRAFNGMAATIEAQTRNLAESAARLEAQNADLQRQIAERVHAEEQLRTAQSALCEASRRAGMVEMASGVLHNVANVINSVHVSVETASNAVLKSELPMLAKVAELLEAQRENLPAFLTQDERGKTVPRFLSLVSRKLGDEQHAVIEELRLLSDNVDHIKDIVSTQQRYAHGDAASDCVNLREVLSDAQRMSSASLQRRGIKLDHDYGDLPELITDKHRVLQILINLLRNAMHALDEAPDNERRITLRLRADPDAREVTIAVIDCGAGMSPEVMAKLFTHGFSTRADGHGFGLHTCRTMAGQLGGSLTAASEGPGRGATFTLRLPIKGQQSNRNETNAACPNAAPSGT